MTSPTRIALVVGALAGMLVPTAAAQQLPFRANPVSWSPNIVHPGEPVSVVLTLRAEPAQGAGAEIRPDGRRDVAVVIRGNGLTRRFETTPLGSGLYRTKLVFPVAGPWHIGVQFRVGPEGPVGETILGKGGACVGDCVEAAQELRGSPSTRRPRFPIGLAIAGGVVLMAALLAAAAAWRRGTSRVPAS